jgi:hypothetical protein
MKRRSFFNRTSLGAIGAGLGGPVAVSGADGARPRRRMPDAAVKTILSFATEAAHAAEDFDFIKAIARFLTDEGLVGNFHLTGDYARALKRLGRLDVVEALQPHEIGYHCNHHGSRPFMPGYLERDSWDDGLARWLGLESPGFALVGELFNRRPAYYTTEFAKAPQTAVGSALLGMGNMGYLALPMRGHSAVWYANSLVPSVEQAVGLESFHAEGDRERMAMDSLDRGLERQQAAGKDVLRVFLHSYKYYGAPPFDRLTMTNEIYKDDRWYYEDFPTDFARQPPERFQASFEMFKRVIRRHAERSGFVTFSEYRDTFQPTGGVWLGLEDLDRIAARLTRSLDAFEAADYALSPADAFGLFVRALRGWRETGALPTRLFARNLIGPCAPLVVGRPERMAAAADLVGLLSLVDRGLDLSGAVPSAIGFEGGEIGPGQLLGALLRIYTGIRESRPVDQVALSGSDLPEIAKEPFFQETTFTRKGLYPDDFTGETICRLALAQSWSWKPAVKVVPKSA